MVPLLLVAAAGAVGVLGWLWWRGDGELRHGSGERILPAEVALPESAFGEAATLLFFTSQQDDRAAGVRALLESVADRPGVAIADVDLTVRGDLAGRYGVVRTPSVLALDSDRRLVARVKGAGDEATLRRALELALERAG